ncbi:hypothetical protein [Neisseria zoodegmatis]|uniref:hypothetical protein n=1 Tax=Neisseria zoodegmatis TaxID=326523 RepID=UPI0012FDD531|nr:hypothetical protein [Neisseria zoodegmatis]
MAGIAKNKEEEFKVFGRVYESFDGVCRVFGKMCRGRLKFSSKACRKVGTLWIIC